MCNYFRKSISIFYEGPSLIKSKFIKGHHEKRHKPNFHYYLTQGYKLLPIITDL